MWQKGFPAAFWAAKFPPAPLAARQNKSTIVTGRENSGCGAGSGLLARRKRGERRERRMEEPGWAQGRDRGREQLWRMWVTVQQ